MNAPQDLIDACAAWCALSGIEPRDIGYGLERTLLRLAVGQYSAGNRTFADLNDTQRRAIAALDTMENL